MQLFDTHTHLYLKQFEEDQENVINSAIELGVKKMILPNIDSISIHPLLEICEKYPDNCYPALGLHPSSVKKNYISELQVIEEWLNKINVCAIGEIGIDLYWDKSFIEEQTKAFNHQIELALKNNLPIIIHMRESFNNIIDVLKTVSSEKELDNKSSCNFKPPEIINSIFNKYVIK